MRRADQLLLHRSFRRTPFCAYRSAAVVLRRDARAAVAACAGRRTPRTAGLAPGGQRHGADIASISAAFRLAPRRMAADDGASHPFAHGHPAVRHRRQRIRCGRSPSAGGARAGLRVAAAAAVPVLSRRGGDVCRAPPTVRAQAHAGLGRAAPSRMPVLRARCAPVRPRRAPGRGRRRVQPGMLRTARELPLEPRGGPRGAARRGAGYRRGGRRAAAHDPAGADALPVPERGLQPLVARHGGQAQPGRPAQVPAGGLREHHHPGRGAGRAAVRARAVLGERARGGRAAAQGEAGRAASTRGAEPPRARAR